MAHIAMRRFVFALLIVLSASAQACAQSACSTAEAPCRVGGGFYVALPPPGWDGQSRLPVLLHFHGFREQAAEILAREDIRVTGARLGVLLVMPQGEGTSWSTPGSPAQSRDDLAFVEAVLADVKTRWPVDDKRLLASGFSQGASMVWHVACHRGHMFSSYLPIAGAFWAPEPEACPSGAQHIRHIHGLADRSVPLTGRPIRNGAFHQGDIALAIGLMRKANGCDAAQSRFRQRGALLCEVAGACSSGKALEFCLHPGGHDFDPSWLGEGMDFLRHLAR